MGGQIDLLVLGDLMAVVDEIVVVIHLYELIGMQHEAVFVIEVVAHDAVVDHHLAVGAKCIVTGRNHTVGFFGRYISGGVCGYASEALETGASAAQIVSAINVVDAGLGLAVNNDVMIAVDLIQTVSNGGVSVDNTVFAKVIPVSGGIGVVLNEADAGEHIGVSAEVVGLAVQLDPHTGIVAGAVAVALAGGIGHPGTVGSAVFGKDISNAANGLLADVQLVIGACEAVLAVACILPAGLQLVVDGVVQIAVHLKDAGAGFVHMAAALVLADELAVDDGVVMVQLLQLGTPVNDGHTSAAVGAVLVAFFRQGGFLAQNGQGIVVDMVGGRNGGQLGCHIDGAAHGRDGLVGEGDLAANDLGNDVDNRLVAHVRGSVVGVGNIVVAVKGPDTDGNADQGVTDGAYLGSVLRLDGNGQQLGDLVVIEGSLEAVGHNRALGLPGVGVVQVQLSDQLGDIGQPGNMDVHIVDGLCHGGFAGIVVTVQFHNGVTGHGEGSGDLHGVAQLVLDLEGHGVGAGNQYHVLLGGEHTACDGRADSDAVHGDLTGGRIQSGVVGDLGRESHLGAGDHSALSQIHSGVGGGVGGVGDGGQHSVIHGGAVVQSDVVDVEGDIRGESGLDVGADEGGRTGVAFIGSYGGAEVIILGNVDGGVHPAGLGDIRVGGGVQVGLLAGGGRGEHEVVLLAGVGAVFVLDIQLGLERHAGSTCLERFFGNVQPHAEGGGLQAVGNVTQDDGVAGVEQHVVGPAGESGVGVVQSPCQSIAAVSDLAAVGGGGHKGLAAQVFVELACQRIGAN